jgi:hypothetical protein
MLRVLELAIGLIGLGISVFRPIWTCPRRILCSRDAAG